MARRRGRRKGRACTRSVGVARRRCKGKKGYKLKTCMRRVMCGTAKRRRRRR